MLTALPWMVGKVARNGSLTVSVSFRPQKRAINIVASDFFQLLSVTRQPSRAWQHVCRGRLFEGVR
jgi:hypothetical protein